MGTEVSEPEAPLTVVGNRGGRLMVDSEGVEVCGGVAGVSPGGCGVAELISPSAGVEVTVAEACGGDGPVVGVTSNARVAVGGGDPFD